MRGKWWSDTEQTAGLCQRKCNRLMADAHVVPVCDPSATLPKWRNNRRCLGLIWRGLHDFSLQHQPDLTQTHREREQLHRHPAALLWAGMKSSSYGNGATRAVLTRQTFFCQVKCAFAAWTLHLDYYFVSLNKSLGSSASIVFLFVLFS